MRKNTLLRLFEFEQRQVNKLREKVNSDRREIDSLVEYIGSLEQKIENMQVLEASLEASRAEASKWEHIAKDLDKARKQALKERDFYKMQIEVIANGNTAPKTPMQKNLP